MLNLLTSNTTGFQLREIAKRLGLTIDYILPLHYIKHVTLQNPNKVTNIILNTHNHWIALFIQKKTCYYFNSFAELYEPLPNDVVLFCQKNGITNIITNFKAIQSPLTGYCGIYVLDFLLYMNKKSNSNIKDYNQFLDKYTFTI